ncbi:hypothetical protein MHYP_G00347640 [Metynnis hypsauchen]
MGSLEIFFPQIHVLAGALYFSMVREGSTADMFPLKHRVGSVVARWWRLLFGDRLADTSPCGWGKDQTDYKAGGDPASMARNEIWLLRTTQRGVSP